MEVGRYFIAIMPDEDSLVEFKALQKELLSLDKSIYKTSLPIHITLKETFATPHIEKLEDDLANLAKNYSPFSIKVKGFKIFNQRCVVLETTNPLSLQELHEESIELANKYRIDETRGGLLKSCKTEKQKEYLLKYNNIFVKEFYTPHLTLVYLRQKKKAYKVSKLLNEKEIDINMKCWGITTVDKKDNKPRVSFPFSN
jgi:2'-5' RNA ligase